MQYIQSLNILGLQSGASKEEIKQAYKRLALKYHPDKNNGDIGASNKFKQINEAYEYLTSNQCSKEQTNNKQNYQYNPYAYNQYYNIHNHFTDYDTYRCGEIEEFVYCFCDQKYGMQFNIYTHNILSHQIHQEAGICYSGLCMTPSLFPHIINRGFLQFLMGYKRWVVVYNKNQLMWNLYIKTGTWTEPKKQPEPHIITEENILEEEAKQDRERQQDEKDTHEPYTTWEIIVDVVIGIIAIFIIHNYCGDVAIKHFLNAIKEIKWTWD